MYEEDTAGYTQRSFRETLEVMSRRKAQMILTGLMIVLLTVILAFGLPPIYRSSSTILIEQQEIPQDLVRSTITSYADQRIQMISQRVMTSANLWSIVEKYDLYSKARKKEPREVVIEDMREDVVMDTISAEVVDPRSGRPTQATIAFGLAYESLNPQRAQKVANELTTLFLNENLKTRVRMTEETSIFLKEEAKKLEQMIADLERQLADFKQKNVTRLPELSQLNMTLMDRTERELFEVDRSLRSLDERKIYLESELAQMSPSATVISQTGERVLGTAGRLKVLEAEYVKRSSVYLPDHPDIRKLKKEIAALRLELGKEPGTEPVQDSTEEIRTQLMATSSELALARQKYSKSHPDVLRLERTVAELELVYQQAQQRSVNQSLIRKLHSDNPAYIQLAAQLRAAESEHYSLRQKRDELQSKLEDLENRLLKTPQIEREYKRLTRDYDHAILKYREIKAKQMEANLAESLEVERKGERFTLIEPPLLPEKPVKPNRLVILCVGFVFALIGAIGLAFVLDAIDGKVHGYKHLRSFLGSTVGQSPVVVVPFILTEKDMLKKRRYVTAAAISTFVGVAIIVGCFHAFVMPMDTFWYVMMRRLGV